MIAEGPASTQLVLSSGIQIADGLAAAHNLGIFHRDLKPANVMLTDGGLIKILDFGLARQLKREQSGFRSGARRRSMPAASPGATYTARGGTIAYMAPEQFVTGQSSVQSDIFALGLILYEMVSGRHPFHRPDAQEMQSIRAIQFAEPPSLREIVPEIPVELESVILRCLEKQPSERFSSAADVREGLKTVLKALQLDSVLMPGRGATNMPAQQRLDMETPEEEKRSTGILSMLAERFRESGAGVTTQAEQHCGAAVCEPGAAGCDAVVWLCAGGCAGGAAGEGAVAGGAAFERADECGDAAARSAERGAEAAGAICAGGKFSAVGQGFRSELAVAGCAGAERADGRGDQCGVVRFDRGAERDLRRGVCGAARRGRAGTCRTTAAQTSLQDDASEEYLQARALLSSFMSRTGNREDLDRARAMFEAVVARDAEYAPAWTGLGHYASAVCAAWAGRADACAGGAAGV